MLGPARATHVVLVASPRSSVNEKRASVVSRPIQIVILGASGDLTSRKLIPALLRNYAEGAFSQAVQVVGVARSDKTSESWRRELSEAIPPELRDAWESFAPGLHWLRADATTPEGIATLREQTDALIEQLPEGWDTDLPTFPADEKGLATRVSSGKVINAIAEKLPDLIGGSADLHPSTMTFIDSAPAFQADMPEGRPTGSSSLTTFPSRTAGKS